MLKVCYLSPYQIHFYGVFLSKFADSAGSFFSTSKILQKNQNESGRTTSMRVLPGWDFFWDFNFSPKITAIFPKVKSLAELRLPAAKVSFASSSRNLIYFTALLLQFFICHKLFIIFRESFPVLLLLRLLCSLTPFTKTDAVEARARDSITGSQLSRFFYLHCTCSTK